MTRGILLGGAVLLGSAAVVLLAPLLMHDHPHHPPHEMDVRRMADGALAYFDSEHAGPDGLPLPARLPPSVGPTPAGPLCGAAPIVDDPGWALLRYAPRANMRSTYTRVSDTAFVARINGDLDCDGVESTFERRCALEAGGFQCAPFEAHVLE